MEAKFILPLLGLFVLLAVSVESLRCYVCSGVNDGPCFDPEVKNATSHECSVLLGPGDYSCFKTISTGGSTDIVSRGCLLKSTIDSFCAVATSNELECAICDEELCNSSNTATISLACLFLSVLLAKLF